MRVGRALYRLRVKGIGVDPSAVIEGIAWHAQHPSWRAKHPRVTVESYLRAARYLDALKDKKRAAAKPAPALKATNGTTPRPLTDAQLAELRRSHRAVVKGTTA